ncbi:MAG: SDR family oxidoreductase [Gemmatimonadota bacterium]
MSSILFTGFPGFLGSELLPRILAREPEARAVCLVQPRYMARAHARLAELELGWPEIEGRTRLREGDITEPDLGLGPAEDLRRETTRVFHLAAAYDLGMTRELGNAVNVAGTRHVVDFAAGCPGLERVHYVSTCYVSGGHVGIFREEDLDRGQRFNNAYEETKFRAEVEVRARMEAGLPATIYRPSIVVGDSATGETQKYDGPYFVIRWLLRQPRAAALLPVVGDPARTRLNVVPRDFVVGALLHLSSLPHARGRTYHLADPTPLTVAELLEVLAEATSRRLVRVRLRPGLARRAMSRLERWTRIPAEALAYFTHPTFYATERTAADLADSGIEVPRFPDYADRLVAFVRRHPEVGSGPMT